MGNLCSPGPALLGTGTPGQHPGLLLHSPRSTEPPVQVRAAGHPQTRPAGRAVPGGNADTAADSLCSSLRHSDRPFRLPEAEHPRSVEVGEHEPGLLSAGGAGAAASKEMLKEHT